MNRPQSLKSFENEVIFRYHDFTAQLCCSPESQKLAFELRYRAYRHVNAIPEQAENMLFDDYDLKPNSRTQILWLHDEPIATVRTSIWSDRYAWLTTEGIDKFWVETHRQIGLEKRVLESNRFAIAPEVSGRNSVTVQLLLFRIQDLNAQVEECPFIITAVRQKHANFYKRMLGFEPISDVIKHHSIDAEVMLLMTTQENSREIVTKKGMPQCEAVEVAHFSNLLKNLKTTSHAVSN